MPQMAIKQTLSFPPDVLAGLRAEAERTGIPMSRIIHQSLRKRWEDQAAEQNKSTH